MNGLKEYVKHENYKKPTKKQIKTIILTLRDSHHWPKVSFVFPVSRAWPCEARMGEGYGKV